MAKPGALVPFLDVGVGPFSRADAFDEIPQMRHLETRGLVRCRLPADVPAFLVENECPLLTMKTDPTAIFQSVLVPDALFPDHRGAGKIERRDLRVRGLAVVI